MRKKIVGLLCFIVIGINSLSYSETPDSGSNEAEWAEFMAGVLNVEDEGVEYALPDGRRIDIYDKENNISYEVDWCKKWPEGIGQSLGYSLATNSEAGLILLFKAGEDEYYNAALGVINHLRQRGVKYHFIVVNVQSKRIWKF